MITRKSITIFLSVAVLFSALFCAGCAGVSPTDHLSAHNMKGPDALDVRVVEGDCQFGPTFLEGKAPLYPPRMATRQNMDYRRSDYAVVRFTVTKEGKAVSPKMVEASHPQFAAGVAHVLPTWRFMPAKLNGESVEVVVETNWVFKYDV